MQDWDLVVVGAGPAGSTAAIAALHADPSARVLLLDAADFPRDKVCGDGIAPHALDVLRELDVDVAALVEGTEPIERLRLHSPGDVAAVREFARPAHVVPRLLFDDRLLQAAVAAGASFRRHRVRSVRVATDAVVIDENIRARVAIGADGAESVMRRLIGARPPAKGTVAIALRGYAPAQLFPKHEQLLVMTRSHWPAYAWAFPIGDGRANVGYGELLQGEPPSRAHLAQRLKVLLPGVAPVGLRGHRLPLSPGRPDVAHGRVLLTGDAASLINPLTGEGIFYAVLSGRLAGASLSAPDPAHAYRRSLRRALGRHLRQTDVIARLGRWPGLLDLGIGAARDSQHVFDTLVDVGLGAGTISPPALTRVVGHWLRRAR